MKRNQTEWIKWYRNKTGKEWKEEDEAASPDLSKLSEKDREVGALLYSRYIREKKDADDLSYREAQEEAATLETMRQAEKRRTRLKSAQEETALANGQWGTDAAAREKKRIDGSADEVLRKARDKRDETKDALVKAYANKRNRADEALDKEMEKVEKKYQALYLENWSDLKKSIQEDLEGYVSEFDRETYTAEGQEAAIAAIQRNKEALGDQYERALSWARALPVYAGEEGGKMLTVGKEKQFVYDRDIAFADVVTYRKGAGAKVSKWDIFSVEYNGVRYTIKAEKAVDEGTGALLAAIADYKQMPLKTGSLIYYRGALYVYNGEGTWHKTANVAAASSPTSLTHLLRAVDGKMNQ